MKKIKEVLTETKEKTSFHVKRFSMFFEKHRILRILISGILIIAVGLAVAFCSGKKNTETASASAFQTNGGYVALNDNPCWYYGFTTGDSLPIQGSLPYNYLSTITNRGYIPSTVQIITNVKQMSPMNLIFNNDISYFCKQINIDNSRPELTYGDNFTDRFIPNVYPITIHTSCTNRQETYTNLTEYYSTFHYTESPFYDINATYWMSNGNTNNNFPHYIGFMTIYESTFTWENGTYVNSYTITYPEYSFFYIIPNSCVIDYTNYSPTVLEYSLSTVSVSVSDSGDIFKYVLTYNNGLKFRFNIINYFVGFEVTVPAVAFGDNRFNAKVPVAQQSALGSEIIQGFNDHTVMISENDAVIFSNGYDQGYAKALSDYSTIEQRNIDNAVKEAVENYNNNIYVDSKSYSAGYTTGEQHADNRVNRDSASYQAGLTAGAEMAGLTPFQFIVNSVSTFLSTPLFTINGWSFTFSYLIYISFGLILVGVLIKTFWGG